jgi:hypothetical protein
MDQIVNLETAKLAMEVGYDREVIHKYGDHGHIILCKWYEEVAGLEDVECNATDVKYGIPAPTQTALSRWLREKHDMYVSVDIAIFKRGWNACIISIPKELVCTNARGFDTYEEAMEEGLKLACKIVKERRSE